jgi:hypothetical protein
MKVAPALRVIRSPKSTDRSEMERAAAVQFDKAANRIAAMLNWALGG